MRDIGRRKETNLEEIMKEGKGNMELEGGEGGK